MQAGLVLAADLDGNGARSSEAPAKRHEAVRPPSRSVRSDRQRPEGVRRGRPIFWARARTSSGGRGWPPPAPKVGWGRAKAMGWTPRWTNAKAKRASSGRVIGFVFRRFKQQAEPMCTFALELGPPTGVRRRAGAGADRSAPRPNGPRAERLSCGAKGRRVGMRTLLARRRSALQTQRRHRVVTAEHDSTILSICGLAQGGQGLQIRPGAGPGGRTGRTGFLEALEWWERTGNCLRDTVAALVGQKGHAPFFCFAAWFRDAIGIRKPG